MLLFIIYLPELMVHFYLHVIYFLNMLFFCLSEAVMVKKIIVGICGALKEIILDITIKIT